ncbi:MAG: archease [Spirochaetes bacterium]|nr:archease [Spirochaetota bacterium]
MAYELLDSISMADIAYRVRGSNLVDLFINGACALISIMLENPESVRPIESVTFNAASPDPDLLYYDFLSEFIFFKDTHRLILMPATVEISHTDQGYSLSCKAMGEKIDRSRHVFIADIKAITMHNLAVALMGDEWRATVVVDV